MAQEIVAQDFKNAHQALEKIRQCQEDNTKLINGALERIEALNVEGETKTAIMNLFYQWQENMEAENTKLGQFYDAGVRVVDEQAYAEFRRSLERPAVLSMKQAERLGRI